MRNEKGYFCSFTVTTSPYQEEIWYGPQKTQKIKSQSFENISTNGITLFPTHQEASTVIPSISKLKGFTQPSIGYMEINMAETEADKQEIKDGANVVLINTTDGPTSELLGYSDQDISSIYPLMSEKLTINGGVPYQTYPDSVVFHESRQGGRITIATLVDFRKPQPVSGYYQLPLIVPK
jgi:hypothetical protein